VIFLHAVIDEKEKKKFEFESHYFHLLHTIPYEGKSVMVSSTTIDFTKEVAKETLVRALLDYQAFLEELMKTYNVIPFKFGTCLSDEKALLSILKTKNDIFEKLLSTYKNKCEISVTAAWVDQKTAFETVLKNNDELSKLKDETDSSLEKRVAFGKKIQEKLLSYNEGVQKKFQSELEASSLKIALYEIANDFMTYHGSHLIWKEQREDFLKKLDTLNNDFHGKYQIRAIGPLPPYSFATIYLNIIPSDQIKKACEVLGLSSISNLGEIKKVHQALSKKFHPDRNPVHQEKFQKIREAYQILSQCHKAHIPVKENSDFIEVEVKEVA